VEWRYKLSDDKIMWVPDDVHNQITQRLQAGPGSCLTITHHKGTGRNGQEFWTVVATPDDTQATAPQAAPPPAPPATPAPAARRAPAPQQQLPAQGEPYGTSMYTSLCAAIQAAAAAERYAAEIGRPMAFDTSDIRAIAATLFIHATGGGR